MENILSLFTTYIKVLRWNNCNSVVRRWRLWASPSESVGPWKQKQPWSCTVHPTRQLWCILTSFWVLPVPKSWSIYFFVRFQPPCYFRPFDSDFFVQKARRNIKKPSFLLLLIVGRHPNAGWLSEGVPQFFFFSWFFVVAKILFL